MKLDEITLIDAIYTRLKSTCVADELRLADLIDQWRKDAVSHPPERGIIR